MRRRRRRRLTLSRPTLVLGVVAVTAAAATAVGEVARVWRRGSAPLPVEPERLLEAAGMATLETLAVVREGYRTTPPRENALLNMLGAFSGTFGLARASTALIRSRRGYGALRNFVIADRHVHHFVPGILLAFGAGGTAIAVHSQDLDQWLALPFGAGAALVLDEAALLLELEDVYWTEDGVLSLQVSFATIALLAALVLGVRLLRRGETSVGIAPAPAVRSPPPPLR